MRFLPLIFIAMFAFPAALHAEGSAEESPPIDIRQEELLEMVLPTTQHIHELDISIRPNSGDVVKQDFIRMPIRLKYGITENWEVSVTPLTYFSNFFRGRLGLFMTDVTIGTKYNFGEAYPGSGVGMAFSFSHVIPVRDDIRISDGYYHYMPGVLFSTKIKGAYILGLGIGLNLVQGKAPPGSIEPNDTMNTGVSLAFINNGVTYTLESLYVTDEIFGGQTEEAYLTPGISLDVTGWLKEIPGVWTFSSGLRIGFLDAPQDFEVIMRLKLHLRFDYKIDVRKLMPKTGA